MFDIGFFEVIFIMIITLLVVGPERLPKVARTAGLWMGKIRGFVTSVKADIDKELATEELKRALAKQASVPELEEIVEKTRSSLSLDNAQGSDEAPEAGKTVSDSAKSVTHDVPDAKES
ncbi:MAG: twin-arginine translocase subunit TatB [Halobacteria archaeon]|nr:twin-arginine translocase subunit TatB [Halobacteria archaeon]